MIEKHLAQKLKDAGFPQTHRFIERGHAAPGVCVCGAITDDEVHIPDIAELMEACGYPVFVHAYHPEFWYAAKGLDSEAIKAEGKEPDEALAYLFLATR